MRTTWPSTLSQTGSPPRTTQQKVRRDTRRVPGRPAASRRGQERVPGRLGGSPARPRQPDLRGPARPQRYGAGRLQPGHGACGACRGRDAAPGIRDRSRGHGRRSHGRDREPVVADRRGRGRGRACGGAQHRQDAAVRDRGRRGPRGRRDAASQVPLSGHAPGSGAGPRRVTSRHRAGRPRLPQ